MNASELLSAPPGVLVVGDCMRDVYLEFGTAAVTPEELAALA